VVGDLTGKPQQSALVVESVQPLPVDGTLNGQLVYVWHQPSPHGQSVYTIAGITRLENNRWQINLAGSPPFLTQRARVLKVDPADPRKFEQDFQFHHLMGQKNVTGRRIRFLRSGFDTTLVETGRSSLSVTDAPPAGAVVKGDAFIVYSIQAGDRVAIPSRFACTGAATADGSLRLEVQATGAATLTVPGRYARATATASGRTTELKATALDDTATTIPIPPAALANGRGSVVLTTAMVK
jgi:hypothetical protein